MKPRTLKVTCERHILSGRCQLAPQQPVCAFISEQLRRLSAQRWCHLCSHTAHRTRPPGDTRYAVASRPAACLGLARLPARWLSCEDRMTEAVSSWLAPCHLGLSSDTAAPMSLPNLDLRSLRCHGSCPSCHMSLLPETVSFIVCLLVLGCSPSRRWAPESLLCLLYPPCSELSVVLEGKFSRVAFVR